MRVQTRKGRTPSAWSLDGAVDGVMERDGVGATGAERRGGDGDLADPESQAPAMRQVFLIEGGENVHFVLESKNWSLWMRVRGLGTAEDLPEGQKRLRVALLDGYEAVSELWEEGYGMQPRLVGFRLREHLTMRQLTIAAGALAEGCPEGPAHSCSPRRRTTMRCLARR